MVMSDEGIHRIPVMKIFSALCCILNVCVVTQGQYVVEVEFIGYNNPTGRCAECPIPAGQTVNSCCDSFVTTTCNGGARCDSYFYFCLRTLGDRGTTNGCSYFGSNTSFAIMDDGPFNFTNLGLDNPLLLPGLTNTFTGVQLYTEILDEDLSVATAPDELVDIILIDLGSSALGATPQRQTYTGVFNFVMMDLSIAVVCGGNHQPPDCIQCLPGFTGANCSVNINDCVEVTCSRNGVCVDGVNSFSCNCNTGFAGQLCNMVDHDDCVSNPCGINGQCMDGINSFSCVCGPGFTGRLCNMSVDMSSSNSLCVSNPCGLNGQCIDGENNYTCQCSPGYSGQLCTQVDRFQISNLLAPLIGGLVGALLLVILVLACISVVGICLMRCGHKGDRKRSRNQGQVGASTGHNAITQREFESSCYNLVGDDSSCCSAQNANSTTVHNSIRSHGGLQSVLSPENSVRNMCYRPESVQERAMQNPPFVNGESSIYADPQFDYQEQCVPDYLWQGVYENMDEIDQEFVPEYLREVVYQNTMEEEQPTSSTEHLYDYA